VVQPRRGDRTPVLGRARFVPHTGRRCPSIRQHRPHQNRRHFRRL